MSLFWKRPYPQVVSAESMHERAKDLIEEANSLLVRARELYGAYVEANTAAVADMRSENSTLMAQISECNELLDALP